MRILAALLVTLVVTAATTPGARGEISPLQMSIDQTSSRSVRGDTKTEIRSLKLSLVNWSKDDLDLKIRYIFIGRDAEIAAMGSRFPGPMCSFTAQLYVSPPRDGAVVAGKGEQAVTVKAGSTVIVEIPAATAVYTRSGRANGKIVRAKGNQFLGYAVLVYRGDKLMTEACEPPEFTKWAFGPFQLSKR